MSAGRHQPLDQFAASLTDEPRRAVLASTTVSTERSLALLARDYPDPHLLRLTAGQIKAHTLENLDTYLAKAEAALQKAGATVHFATDAAAARQTILSVLRAHGASRVVKSKSMATEEVELNPFLESNGIDVVETDLGEFIVQIDHDHPSHIVRPIIHKTRAEIARSFEREGLGAYDDDPATITRRARHHLRAKFLASDAAITGANFVSADSGRLTIVTNEGNARFSLAANRLHIALVGIEKIVPRDRDLALFLNLLGRSATAQQLTVYTQFINGPRARGQPSGPDAMHVVFLDNGRADILASDCREILRCIRCSACQNVCPVYRQAGGHAYRAVYGGPLGAVLTPLLSSAAGRFADFADLPRASSLCGACREVCPVDIPIPDMLLKLRSRAHTERVPSPGTPPVAAFAKLATSPRLWRASLSAANLLNHAPDRIKRASPLGGWLESHTLPPFHAGHFRRWMSDHQRQDPNTEPNPKPPDADA